MSARTLFPPKPAAAYRVLHTADWHLGKQLNERSREDEHARFLQWLLSVVEAHEVDAIIVAGDVFDTANPSQATLALYYNFVSRLHRIGGRSLVVAAGNHDSPAHLEAPKQALRALNVHVVGFMPERPEAPIVCLPDELNPKVVIAAIPFLRDRDLRISLAGEDIAAVRANIVNGIRERYADAAAEVKELGHACPAIALGHLTVLGAKISESEREIHLGGLGSVGADIFPSEFGYVALGHLHRPQSVGMDGRIHYAGSPMALSFSEAEDQKVVRILDVSSDGIAQKSFAVPRFRRLAQIRTKSVDLERVLKAFDPQHGEFKTWVEIAVEDATLEDEIGVRVESLAAKLGLEVLKVSTNNAPTFTCFTSGEVIDDDAIGSLLDDPERVFEHLLARRVDVVEGDVAELRAAFAQIVEMDEQSAAAGPA